MSGRIFYPSVFNPPGAFTTTAPVAAPRGGEVFYPHATRRRVPQRASGELFLPPGNFTRTPPPTPPLGARRTYPFVEPSSKPLDTEDLLRGITQKLSALINSLFGKGYIVQDGNNSWSLVPAVGRQPRNPGPNDDVTARYYPGMLFINTGSGAVFVNTVNTAGAAVWVQIG